MWRDSQSRRSATVIVSRSNLTALSAGMNQTTHGYVRPRRTRSGGAMGPDGG
jgi:hypothetical protein